MKNEPLAQPKDAKVPKDEEGCLVIMRLVERDDQSIFQTIESDEEFERVVAHVEQMAKKAQSEILPEEQ